MNAERERTPLRRTRDSLDLKRLKKIYTVVPTGATTITVRPVTMVVMGPASLVTKTGTIPALFATMAISGTALQRPKTQRRTGEYADR